MKPEVILSEVTQAQKNKHDTFSFTNMSRSDSFIFFASWGVLGYKELLKGTWFMEGGEWNTHKMKVQMSDTLHGCKPEKTSCSEKQFIKQKLQSHW